MAANYSFPDHGNYWADRSQQKPKYRLIRSPRFIKQLSEIRAASRQQMLQMGKEMLLNEPAKRLSPSSTASNQSASCQPDTSHLLLMMSGAFPSPRSSSTTASTDNLQSSSTNLLQPPSFVSTQKVQLAPRSLLVVPQISHNPPVSSGNIAKGFVPGPTDVNHLTAISCLASPPWTRSTSPASPNSNTSSLSPQPVYTTGHTPLLQKPHVTNMPPPTISPPTPREVTDKSHVGYDHRKEIKINFVSRSKNEEPPCYAPPPPPPPPPMPQPSLLKKSTSSLSRPLRVTTAERKLQDSPPPPPPGMPQPALFRKSTPTLSLTTPKEKLQDAHRRELVAALAGRSSRVNDWENLEPPSHAKSPPATVQIPVLLRHSSSSMSRLPTTPCQLISTTSRPVNIRPRASSATSMGPFCANPKDGEEPFTLIPLPKVDPGEFPEQSWAHRNVRKLVSRLSAHVKARRRKTALSTTAMRNAISTECLSGAHLIDDLDSDDLENLRDQEAKSVEMKQELDQVSQLVREQFGGSLSCVLRSTPQKNLRPLSTGSQPVVPIAQGLPKPKSVSELRPTKQPLTQYRPKLSIISRNNPSPTRETVKATPPKSGEICRYAGVRCFKCHYCTSLANAPLARYGLRGRHVHLPPEELDLNSRAIDISFCDDDTFDETDVPRSALSPECGFADPVADDMFRRTLVRAVRF